VCVQCLSLIGEAVHPVQLIGVASYFSIGVHCSYPYCGVQHYTHSILWSLSFSTTLCVFEIFSHTVSLTTLCMYFILITALFKYRKSILILFAKGLPLPPL